MYVFLFSEQRKKKTIMKEIVNMERDKIGEIN